MKPADILSAIDSNQQQIDAHGAFDQDVLKKINYKFRLDWNYYSNRMEGGTLTREETRSVMIGNIDVKGKPLKDVMEMNGHDKLVLDILKMGKGTDRIAEKRIKAIHRAIMHEDDPELAKSVGEWKTTGNEIINYKGEKIPFAEPSEVKEKVHQLLDKTNAELDKFFSEKPSKHPLEIAAQFHIDFVTIHPFYDGNGRTTRILTNLILISCGFPPIIIKEQHKNSYYQLLADIQVYGGNADLFYAFLGERLLESQQLVLDAIAGKDIEEEDDIDKEIKLWKKQLAPENSNVLQRTNERIIEIYQHSLKPLFETYIDRHQQFDELFSHKRIANILGNYHRTVKSFDFFEHWINFIKAQNDISTYNYETAVIVAKLAALKVEYGEDVNNIGQLRNMGFEIYYQGFTKNENNPFDILIGLKVTFKESNYLIQDRVHIGNKPLKKLYSQFLSDDEISDFVTTSLKDNFNQIRSIADTKD